jgi:hypothetical protein
VSIRWRNLYKKGSVDKGCAGWNYITIQDESQRSSLSNVNKHNTQQNGEAYSPVLANQNTDRFVKMMQQKQKNKSVINKEEKSCKFHNRLQ